MNATLQTVDEFLASVDHDNMVYVLLVAAKKEGADPTRGAKVIVVTNTTNLGARRLAAAFVQEPQPDVQPQRR